MSGEEAMEVLLEKYITVITDPDPQKGGKKEEMSVRIGRNSRL